MRLNFGFCFFSRYFCRHCEFCIWIKKITETNYERLKQTSVYIKSNLIDLDGNMYLTIDSLTI